LGSGANVIKLFCP